MPKFCIFQDKLISTEDIYKFNIDKNADFICYTCGKRLHFRQSRNADKKYTEHFYHQNTTKDTHIECENFIYENIQKHKSEFHTMFSNFIKDNCKEIIRLKHIVDGYDKEHDRGIEFQNSKISEEDIQNRDKTTNLDWIFNVENQYVKHVDINNQIICEVPHNNWEKAIKAVKNNLYLYTGFKTWICLRDRNVYRIAAENKLRNVWIGEPCSFQDVLENTCLKYIIIHQGLDKFSNMNNDIDNIKFIYARCKNSMYLLDDIYRNYINSHDFKTNDILAIKAVAGSGKTTTLLNLSKIHNNKKILYIAFNKSLIIEIKDKIRNQNIKNMYPFTFDALLYKLYIATNGCEPTITNLRPQFIGKIIPYLDGKPYNMREYYCKRFIEFCSDINYNDIRTYCLDKFGCEKPLLEQMWNKVVTFESIRKQCYIKKLFKNFIDANYDLIMIDETQDFDMIMLKMLLNDTTIPKIFVGDTKQSIYNFRGCINAFNYLPKDTLVLEFYSTFRIGNPACEEIRTKFDDCWMVSKSKNETYFVNSFEPDEQYIYLFRSWRVLLKTAEKTNNIWIYTFDKKINEIRNLHNKLQKNYLPKDDESKFEDDLPKFLKSITSDQLENLLNNISANLVSFEESNVKFYTTHSYKGMEDNNIRIANDIDINENENIYYVAITRGMKKIVLDKL
jgi:G3E family GTPase